MAARLVGGTTKLVPCTTSTRPTNHSTGGREPRRHSACRGRAGIGRRTATTVAGSLASIPRRLRQLMAKARTSRSERLPRASSAPRRRRQPRSADPGAVWRRAPPGVATPSQFSCSCVGRVRHRWSLAHRPPDNAPSGWRWRPTRRRRWQQRAVPRSPRSVLRGRLLCSHRARHPLRRCWCCSDALRIWSVWCPPVHHGRRQCRRRHGPPRPAHQSRPRHHHLHAGRHGQSGDRLGRDRRDLDRHGGAGHAGGESWFRLGDRDLATHLFRTERLRAGPPSPRSRRVSPPAGRSTCAFSRSPTIRCEPA